MVDLKQFELTERQEAIAQGLIRRTPYKVIASDLGIAESTVTDHIKALRRKFEVQTTHDLVGLLIDAEFADWHTPQFGGEGKKRVEDPAVFGDLPEPNGDYVLADAATSFYKNAGFWPDEPIVVPEELDGPNAIVPRLQAIGKTLVLILAAVVLTVAAINGINSLVLGMGVASAD